MMSGMHEGSLEECIFHRVLNSGGGVGLRGLFSRGVTGWVGMNESMGLLLARIQHHFKGRFLFFVFPLQKSWYGVGIVLAAALNLNEKQGRD